jgi:uncharacterized membrane protein (DUF4010 family)
MPDLPILFQRFAIALALGLLIGIEREREKIGSFAGIRTFPLIALMGCAAALIQDFFADFMFPVGFAILAALVLRSYVITGTATAPGITTEVTSLLAFLFGGLVWWELTAFAAAAAVVTVLLLAAKQPLEQLSHRIGHPDIMAALQFGVITLIVLPLLPNRTFGPLNVLNPHTIWLMVVLIAGVNLVGYALVKIFGSRQGIALAGVLGGLASSTALTLGFARRSRHDQHLGPLLALAILIASTIMFARMLVISASVDAELGRALLIPMALIMGTGVALCILLWLVQRESSGAPEATSEIIASNPLEIWTAIQFGALFGAILLIAKTAQMLIGDVGIYLSSAMAGLADVDAITLSLTNLAHTGTLRHTVAAQGILLAGMSNTLIKAVLVAVIGVPRLSRYTLPAFLMLILAVGFVVLFAAR